MHTLTDNSQNNKRIAKNTLLLYLRMLVMMAVSLYTSRIVLEVLGVLDYGVYNVVGGVVVLFTFINSAMSASTRRFLTYSIGESNHFKLQKIFSTSIIIHVFISLIIILLCETIGLWILYYEMIIPKERIEAAFWVFQFSVATTIVLIMSVPYNAVIIAHEKMGAFAYISILEVVLKLLIVYFLVISSVDKLKLYAVLMFGVQILSRIIYGVYCRIHFKEAVFRFSWNKSLFGEMIKFAGWSLFGNLAAISYTQGLNLLLNLFFNPIVNAARAVAFQVENAIMSFAGNFQLAFAPQIVKYYASENLNLMYTLIYRSARITFMLMLFLTLPILIDTDYILNLWLKNPPFYSSDFVRMVLIISVVNSVSNPFVTAAEATGQIRGYQLICGGTLLLIIPISYYVLYLGGAPVTVLYVQFIVCLVVFVERLYLLRSMIGLSLKLYFKNVIVRCLPVVIFSPAVPLLMLYILDTSFLRLVIIVLTSCISVIVLSLRFGLFQSERVVILDKVKEKIAKFKW